MKTCLLTGASRGIGHATVKVLQSQGRRVLTVSRQPFSEECRWPLAQESHIQADLTDLNAIPALAAEVRARLSGGRLEALVNNAATSPKGPYGARMGIADTPQDVWTQVLNVNLVSIALPVRELLPELEGGAGLGRQRHLDRRLAGASLRRGGLFRLEGRAGGADARAGA